MASRLHKVLQKDRDNRVDGLRLSNGDFIASEAHPNPIKAQKLKISPELYIFRVILALGYIPNSWRAFSHQRRLSTLRMSQKHQDRS